MQATWVQFPVMSIFWEIFFFFEIYVIRQVLQKTRMHSMHPIENVLVVNKNPRRTNNQKI